MYRLVMRGVVDGTGGSGLIDLRAFSPEYFPFTLGGFARILALMTGIEIFADMVAADVGPDAKCSRKRPGAPEPVDGAAVPALHPSVARGAQPG